MGVMKRARWGATHRIHEHFVDGFPELEERFVREREAAERRFEYNLGSRNFASKREGEEGIDTLKVLFRKLDRAIGLRDASMVQTIREEFLAELRHWNWRKGARVEFKRRKMVHTNAAQRQDFRQKHLFREKDREAAEALAGAAEVSASAAGGASFGMAAESAPLGTATLAAGGDAFDDADGASAEMAGASRAGTHAGCSSSSSRRNWLDDNDDDGDTNQMMMMTGSSSSGLPPMAVDNAEGRDDDDPGRGGTTAFVVPRAAPGAAGARPPTSGSSHHRQQFPKPFQKTPATSSAGPQGAARVWETADAPHRDDDSSVDDLDVDDVDAIDDRVRRRARPPQHTTPGGAAAPPATSRGGDQRGGPFVVPPPSEAGAARAPTPRDKSLANDARRHLVAESVAMALVNLKWRCLRPDGGGPPPKREDDDDDAVDGNEPGSASERVSAERPDEMQVRVKAESTARLQEAAADDDDDDSVFSEAAAARDAAA